MGKPSANPKSSRSPEPPALTRRSVGLGVFRGSVPLALVCLSGLAQVVPPQAVEQLQQVVGNRIEAVSILGGDYAAAGGVYTFRGGNLADLSISKLGGGGEVASTRPLGVGNFEWAPVLQGNVGMVSARNQFETGFLAGNEMTYDTLALAAGGGVAIYCADHLSLSPTISGMYGRVENKFSPQNANGNLVEAAGNGTLVNWTLDTWSVVPGLEMDYEWQWGRTTLELSSRCTYFYTESFESSSPILGVNGNSTTWQNKLEADVPLGLKLFGREFHTGGFFSRTEVFGDAAHGLSTDYVYTVTGRLVLDFLGKLWKVQWLGLGASYFWGHNLEGWSAGLDMRFKF